MKRTACILAALAILAFAFYVLHRADQSMRTSTVASTAATSVPPIGTWLADTGPIFQFRPDGTGRSYDPGSPQFGVHYFEWACDGSTFTIFYAPRGRIRSFIAHQIGLETANFALDELTPDSLVLSDDTAKWRFTPTTDAVLDASR